MNGALHLKRAAQQGKCGSREERRRAQSQDPETEADKWNSLFQRLLPNSDQTYRRWCDESLRVEFIVGGPKTFWFLRVVGDVC